MTETHKLFSAESDGNERIESPNALNHAPGVEQRDFVAVKHIIKIRYYRGQVYYTTAATSRRNNRPYAKFRTITHSISIIFVKLAAPCDSFLHEKYMLESMDECL